VVKYIAAGRLALRDGRVHLDGAPIAAPLHCRDGVLQA
jgi:hypothetical protein